MYKNALIGIPRAFCQFRQTKNKIFINIDVSIDVKIPRINVQNTPVLVYYLD